ncbi:MAG: UvrB/UvrC motif-containing protein [Deltaproteobacteria bacterium]|nr:UvrB/UvrC motif-containing protein [Deltaproteobacteria bacterium]
MEKSAFRQDFESAALYRDRLFALKNTLEKQVVATADFKDRERSCSSGEDSCLAIGHTIFRKPSPKIARSYLLS